MPGPSVAILVGPGVALFELASAWEIFGSEESGMGEEWYSAFFCGSQPTVESDGPGVTISGVKPLRALRRASLVVVPPLRADAELLAAIRDAHRRGARVASLCTGAFVLGQAGLLDGRSVTTHWCSADRLAAEFPAAQVDSDVLYVDHGDILTSAGSAAAIDLCLHLVQVDFGAEVANRIAREMVVPPHRAGGQSQYVSLPVPTTADAGDLAETLEWARAHLDQPLGAADLARHARMSKRTFARRFGDVVGTTPHRWVLRQRVLHAQRLLETTSLPVDRVAEASGLGTPANLRLQFRQVLGTSPSSYRQTFQTKVG